MRIFLLGLAFALALVASPARAAAPPVVAAASDLRFALEELAAAFHRAQGTEVRLAFGSSGNFARQIRQGAPYQLFLSADEAYALALAAEGYARDRGVLYAVGRLALLAPRGSPLAPPDGSLGGLERLLAEGRLGRLAIANPAHAPYGRAAEEVLRRRGLWQAIQAHLVLGENVSQAAQFALGGGADGGLVAWSLALALSGEGVESALVPADWHRPLRQRMVLLRGAGPVAERFYAFVQSPPGRAILRHFGFALPERP